MKGLRPAMSAAREAFEEAGVTGVPEPEPLGSYHYEKRLRSGGAQLVRVVVYPLAVSKEEARWPECGQREKRWLPTEVAAELVTEPELKLLIREFGVR